MAKPVQHPYALHNRRPTPQDLLELSSRIYKASRKLYSEADAQGMRVYHDELLAGDVRLVMLVPQWMPKAHVPNFDWGRVQGERVSVVLVLRGTMQDLVGNTKANLQLVYNKLVDDQHLPDTATDATKVVRAWLHTLLLRHPCLDPGAAGRDSNSDAHQHQHQQQQQQDGGRQQQQQQQQQGEQRRLHLDVHVTGHSLGGLLAEAATVESCGFAATHGMEWHCTSFESPGLPELYYNAALRIGPQEHWDDVITSFLAAPNVINMLYRHLGRIVHVVVPWEQTWSYVMKCVGADVARVTAWAIVGGMVVAGTKQLSFVAKRHAEEEAANRAAAAAGQLSLQQCPALLPPSGAATAAAAAGRPAATAALAPAGPRVPEFIIVAATPSSAADAAGGAAARCLLSGSFPATAAAAAAGAVGGGGGGAVAATQPQALTAAMVGAAAAAGEAAASLGGGRVLHGVLRRSGLGALASVLGGWVFGRGGVWGVMECLAGVLGVEVEELMTQHALGPMRQCFDPHTGELKPRYCRKMVSWPHLGTRGRVILTAAKQVAKWTMPSFVCRDNVGVANIMSRTAMVEARCARLQGYEVLEDTEELRLVLGAAGYPADAAAAAAAGVAAPLLGTLQDDAEEGAGEQRQQRQHDLEAGAAGVPLAALEAGPSSGAAGLPRRLRLFDPQQQQQQQQQQHEAAPAAPRGLGLGLGRHPQRPGPHQGDQHQHPHGAAGPGCDDLMVMSPRHAGVMAGGGGGLRQRQQMGGAGLLAAAAAGALGMAGVEGGLAAMVEEAAALGGPGPGPQAGPGRLVAAATGAAASAAAAAAAVPTADAAALLEMHEDGSGLGGGFGGAERMEVEMEAEHSTAAAADLQGGMLFDDAVEVTREDLMCAEGLPIDVGGGADAADGNNDVIMTHTAAGAWPCVATPAAAPAGGFIRLQHVGVAGLGGALEAVRPAAAVAAARGPGAVDDDDEGELLQQAGSGLLQLHLSGC